MHGVTRNDCARIHGNALRVLEEIGLRVVNDALLEALGGLGARIAKDAVRE